LFGPNQGTPSAAQGAGGNGAGGNGAGGIGDSSSVSSANSASGGDTGSGGSQSGAGGDTSSTGGAGGDTSSSGGASSSSGGPAVCGNGVAEGGEACDGNDLAGKTCADHGFVQPSGLACDKECEPDIAGCAAVCGNGQTEPGEDCDDANLNPKDGCDLCKFDGASCANAIGVWLKLGEQIFQSTTKGGGNQVTSEQHCQSGAAAQTASATDRIYAVTPIQDGFLTASLTYGFTQFDAVLYMRSDCNNPQTEIGCADNYSQGSTPGGEVMSFYAEKDKTYYLIIDGWGEMGDYELVLDLSLGTCLDPVRFPIWKGRPMSAFGTTEDATNESSGKNSCGGSNARDVVYQVTPHLNATAEATLPKSSSNFDTVVYAQTSCGIKTTQTGCDGGGNVIDIDINTTAGVPFYLWVDGQGQQNGEYELVIDPDKSN
jgi:cysteine-rich repeat protein